MFGDDKPQAPREDIANDDKMPESSKSPGEDRPRSKGRHIFTDWASI